jgi:hypothetical protein
MGAPVNLSLAPPTTSELAESLSALSTADCHVDAGPVPGLAYARCAVDDCPAVGVCHVVYEDRVGCRREGDGGVWYAADWCAAHVEREVVHASQRATYVDVECRTPVTAGAEAVA